MIALEKRPRRLTGFALLAMSLSFCSALFATEPPPPEPYQGVDPGQPFKIDLRGGRIIDPLPFDVQFYFQAPVEAKVQRATGRFKGSKKRMTCGNLFPSTEVDPVERYLCVDAGCTNLGDDAGKKPTSDVTSDPEGCRQPGMDCDISFVRIFKDADNSDARTLELSVPEILPNRHYCFEFTLEDQIDDIADFRELIWIELDAELKSEKNQQKDLNGNVVGFAASAKAYNELRQRLIAAIKNELKKGETLSAPPLSFFDPRSSLWDLERVATKGEDGGAKGPPTPKALDEFNAVISSQLEIKPARENYEKSCCDADTGGGAMLAKLLGDPSYQDYRKMAKALGATGVFLDFGKDDAVRLAQGLAAGADPPDLTKDWEPRMLDPQIDQLEQASNLLLSLMERMTVLSGDDALAKKFGLDKTSADNLVKLVRDAFIAVKGSYQRLKKLQGLFIARDQGIQAIVAQLEKQLIEVVRIQGTTEANYETRAGMYMGADLGIAYAWDLDDVFTYLGTSIYFRPINKKARVKGSFLKRFSLMIGVAIDKPKQEATDKDIAGVIMDRGLMLGGGFRISDHFRVTLGTIVFKRDNPDPLINNNELMWSPMISASVDWNLRNLFSKLGGGFAK